MGIFVESHIPRTADAVFRGIPMTDDEFEQLHVAASVLDVAGGVRGNLGF